MPKKKTFTWLGTFVVSLLKSNNAATEKNTQSCQFLVISLGKVISSRRKDVIKFSEKLEDDMEKKVNKKRISTG